ncbi:MAG: elongation factor P [Candidatus Liptonbacteria bacterium]|nr:elongation factor P [Candidatus Liptonbacteria bacterium]
MLAYSELTKGTLFILEGAPYEVIEMSFLRMQQRKATVNTKIRNLITGKILERNWQASDSFEEAEIEKKNAKFIYANRGEYWFTAEKDPSDRFALAGDVIGDSARFLKPNIVVSAMIFKGKVIKVAMPIKMDFKVTEAPPSIKGNTAQGGSKVVTLEGGATVDVPLFINEGDIIKVNTEAGEYVERVEKQ